VIVELLQAGISTPHPFVDFFGSLWLQNLILAVTATIGLWSYISSSRHERRRDTVDVLLQTLNDPEANKALDHMHDLVRQGLDIPHLLAQSGLKDRRIILSVLNRYEFIASGLKTGAFDKAVYKRMYFSSVVEDWRSLYPFVLAFRESRQLPTVYQDFEELANQWAIDRLERSSSG
jgi:hypothetical protein